MCVCEWWPVPRKIFPFDDVIMYCMTMDGINLYLCHLSRVPSLWCPPTILNHMIMNTIWTLCLFIYACWWIYQCRFSFFFLIFKLRSVICKKSIAEYVLFHSMCKLNLALEYQYTYILGTIAVDPPWGQKFYCVSPDHLLIARWPDMGWNTFDFHVV